MGCSRIVEGLVGLVLVAGTSACGGSDARPTGSAPARDEAASPGEAGAPGEAASPGEGKGAAGAAQSAKAAAGEGTLALGSLPGSIVFISERDGNLEVYRVRPGSEPERLTDDPRADFVGEVPADGSGWTRVITEDGASPDEHREQLLWMPREGEPVSMGEPGRRARSASWAPDRSFAVLESDREGAFSDIWRWEPSGSLRRLTQTEQGAFEPAVSPDGRSIAYVSTQDGNPELYVMTAQGEDARRLTDWRRDDLSPRWSPDGTQLAFLRREQGGERLMVVDVSDPGQLRERRVVPVAQGERVKHADHAWSPDGRSLAYTVHRPDTAPQVVITLVDEGTTTVVSPAHLRATMPSWSPDGRYLVLAGTEDQPEALDLYVVAREGGAWARVTRHPAPDWLPRWSAG